MSKILKASNKLKSGVYTNDTLAPSNSLSKDTYSLSELTNSSSSCNLRVCFRGDLDLSPSDYFNGLIWESLKGEDSLAGVAIYMVLLCLPTDDGLSGEL